MLLHVNVNARGRCCETVFSWFIPLHHVPRYQPPRLYTHYYQPTGVYTEPDYYCLNVVWSSPPRVGVGVPILPTLPTAGALSAARFSAPRGVALSPDGSVLFVADSGNGKIKTVSLGGGGVTTLLGGGVGAPTALEVTPCPALFAAQYIYIFISIYLSIYIYIYMCVCVCVCVCTACFASAPSSLQLFTLLVSAPRPHCLSSLPGSSCRPHSFLLEVARPRSTMLTFARSHRVRMFLRQKHGGKSADTLCIFRRGCC